MPHDTFDRRIPSVNPVDTQTATQPRQGRDARAEPTLRVVFREGRPVDEPPVELARGALLIGRSPSGATNLLAFPADRMQSRTHCTIRRDRGGLVCADQQSHNGTWLNGRRIDRAPLDDGDVLRLGDTFIVVRLGAAPPDAPVPELVGDAPGVASLRATLHQVAPTRAITVLLGESGVGKGASARALHRLSGRRGPFVSVNCAAIPDNLAESLLFGHVRGAFTDASADQTGYFRAAHGGTLFIDEIGDLPALLQPKLLHALEDGAVVPVGSTRPQPVDVRIVTATSADLRLAVEEKRFRGDLYARLAEFVIELPPLRDRPEDVLKLLARFLEPGLAPIDPDLVEALLTWDWPYNVRELKNVATQLSVRGRGTEALTRSMVPDLDTSPETAPRAPGRTPDRDALVESLARHAGVVSEVARELGLSRRHLYRLLDKHGLDPADHRV
ncbi:MAG: sigma 54-interacting transcriptional regulator [Alphaproteobacteria bacterium]|nr:sigma 54-interacting transcriptional regulator [Alphaproteobacteria bacterium]